MFIKKIGFFLTQDNGEKVVIGNYDFEEFVNKIDRFFEAKGLNILTELTSIMFTEIYEIREIIEKEKDVTSQKRKYN